MRLGFLIWGFAAISASSLTPCARAIDQRQSPRWTVTLMSICRAPAKPGITAAVHRNYRSRIGRVMGRYLITGGNSGIGLEVGRGLASKGHEVVLMGRSQ